MDEKPKNNQARKWPERNLARRRLSVITVAWVPFFWVLYAYCEKSWTIKFASGESLQHLVEWIGLLAFAAAVVFFASLSPGFAWLARFIDWLGSARIARRVVIIGIWVVTVMVFFYVEEDWRGARVWNRMRTELEAKGKQLTLTAFIPPPIPDEENFAATPVIKSWFVEADRSVFTNSYERFAKNWQDNYEQIIQRFPGKPQMGSRQFMDLDTWKVNFEAVRSGQTNLFREPGTGKFDQESRATALPAILTGLKTNETVLAELETASQRPLCRYPVIYDTNDPWGIMLPHLSNLRDADRRLQLRACAELAGRRSNEALVDVKLILYLGNSVKEEPILISYLVRAALVQLAVQAVWEGLAEHAWSDAQLQEVESAFQRYNFVADVKLPFDGERTMGVLAPDAVREKGVGFLIDVIGPGQPTAANKRFADWLGAFIPRGWFDQEKANYCRLFQEQIKGVFDPVGKRIFASRMEANEKQVSGEMDGGTLPRAVMLTLNHRLMTAMIYPALMKFSKKAAGAQTAADQAALACALERYRLANGKFPETLAALEPKFISSLPHDVITGEPYKYKLTGDGQFILYSVGWNEKDDGGVPGEHLYDDNGDWVWQYSAK